MPSSEITSRRSLGLIIPKIQSKTLNKAIKSSLNEPLLAISNSIDSACWLIAASIR